MCLHYKYDQKSTGKWARKLEWTFREPQKHYFEHKSLKYESKAPQKPHILTQLDEIYRLVRDLTIFEKKNFLTFFDQRGDPYHEN